MTTATIPGVIGFMVVEPSPVPSAPPVADWDGDIHPTREQAETERDEANHADSEDPDRIWRVVAVVEADAIAEAEKRGALDALHWLKLEHRDWAYAIDDLMRRIESGRVTP